MNPISEAPIGALNKLTASPGTRSGDSAARVVMSQRAFPTRRTWCGYRCQIIKAGQAQFKALVFDQNSAKIVSYDTTRRFVHKTVDIDLLEFSKLRPKGPIDEPSILEVDVLRNAKRVVQPLTVRSLQDTHPTRYEIVLGERWWLAAQQAGLHRIDIEVCDDLSNDAVRALLRDAAKRGGEGSPLARARRCSELLSQKLTQEEVALRMHLSRTQVAHLVRLLKLAPDIQMLVESGRLKPGPARALVGLAPTRQRYYAREFIEGRMSTQDIERAAATEKSSGRSNIRYGSKVEKRSPQASAGQLSVALRQAPHPDPDVARLEGQIGESTGLATEIDWDPSTHRGVAVFAFSSLEEFEGLLSRLGIDQE